MSTSTMTAVREEFEHAEPGTLIPTARLLRHGPRAAVDQALSRLKRAGEISRVTRGMYYRPKMNRYVGAVPPEPQAVAEALAGTRGESISIHGAEAARQFGLSTQVPLSPVYLTSGPSRTVKLGQLTMRFKHVSSKELVLAGRPSGEALRALRYLGAKQVTPAVIAKVQGLLPAAEFKALREETSAMPGWLSDAFFRFEQLEDREGASQERALA